MKKHLTSLTITASLAVFGTACAGDYEELEGEGSVESIEQGLLPATGLQLKITVGDNGLSSGNVYAYVKYVDAAPDLIPLNSGAWAANSTQTIAFQLDHPEDVYDIFLRYGNGQTGDHNDWWNISGLKVHDVRNGALSTQRFELGYDISFSPVAAIYDEARLGIPNVLLRARSTNLNNPTEHFSITYQTWNGGRYCASIENNKFTHAPLLGSGCDWRNSHEEAYMDYVSWDGLKWRARVNTSQSVLLFTHERKSGPTPFPAPHSSANLRYKHSNGQHWELRMKPWDDDNN